MKKILKMIFTALLFLILLVSCKNSETLGDYHDLESETFTGMHIMSHDDMSKTKEFLEVQTQEIYDYFMAIKSEESKLLSEDHSLSEPNYSVLLHFENIDYNLAVGDNYIVVLLNKEYQTADEIFKNTSLHLIKEATILDFEAMLEKLLDEHLD